MDNLRIKGSRELLGKNIPVIEGGFGKDKKCLTDKMISEIHGIKTIHVRENINRNIDRFKNGIDYINLKGIGEYDTLFNLGYSKQSIVQADTLYLLSERGYAKLIKIMDNDKAWEIHDIIMDEYFTMKESLNSDLQVLDINQMINDMMPTLIQNTIQSTMLAMSAVLEKNNQLLMSKIENAERGYLDAKNIITEQEIRHEKELNKTKNLIGLRTKNTNSLTKLLKARLSDIKGCGVMAGDYHYAIAKERIFRHLDVWTWESIPVSRYDEVHALIDSLESLDDIFTM